MPGVVSEEVLSPGRGWWCVCVCVVGRDARENQLYH